MGEDAGNALPVASGRAVTAGGLWDHFAAPVASYPPSPNTLHFNASFSGSDRLSLISTVFDLPAGAITPQAPTNTAIPIASPLALGGLGAALALWGVYGLRRREKKATR